MGRAMGAWRRLGGAAACAAILCSATRSGASTVVDPIARLSLEGRYDSNALYDGGGGDRIGSVSPELGLRVRDHLWDLRGSYGGDFLYYERIQPGGIWNHRGALSLNARPTRRLVLDGSLRASYAYDPAGLAQAGVFRTGRQSALLAGGRFRAEWRATRRIDLAATLMERTVLFEDGTGGAMHAPGLEALRRMTPRLSLGGSYTLGISQTFLVQSDRVALSHGVHARARYHVSRRFSAEAFAGPTLWTAPGSDAIMPEAGATLLGSSREWDLSLSAAHGLGIGSTALPGLVDSFEFGGERRIARRYFLRSHGGLWRSGKIPSGRDAVTGYAVTGEAGALLTDHVRMSLVATHFDRMTYPSPKFRRTTVGLRLAWELPVR